MASNRTVEYMLARREILDRAIERKLLEQARFGENDDYEDGSILTFDIQYQSGGIKYDFVAIKCAGRWYTTSQFDKVLTWDQLIDKYLSKAESVWIVTQLKELE